MQANGFFVGGMALQGLQSTGGVSELHEKEPFSNDCCSASRICLNFNYKHTRDHPWIHDSSFQEERSRRRFKDAELSVLPAREEDVHDPGALLDSIKTCGIHKDLHKGIRIHADIIKGGLLQRDIYVSSALLRMYAKCGVLAKAQEVFDELPARDIVTWNALIAGYAQHGLGEEAFDCFGRMRDEGFLPDSVTFVSIVKACSSIGSTEKGEEVHAEVRKQGLLDQNVVLGTALVDMYCKCGALSKAQEAFDELPKRNIVSWNALITGYVQHGLNHEALKCFGQMQDEGISPDAITFVCILKVCASMGASERGKVIHAEVEKQRLLEKNIVLGTALVDMYAKCGALEKAQEVFDKLPRQDLALWNALVAGYAQHGLGEKALECFEQMQDAGFSPDEVTFVCILKACGSIAATERGEEIHAEAGRQGLLDKNIVLGTALVDMYAKCGALVRAQEVFDELPIQNVASWTALITGYAQHGQGSEALKCFEKMIKEGHSPNAITFVCILKACGSIGALEKGEEIHAEVGRQGLLGKSIVLGNALVDMYAKCGTIAKAQEVFEELPARNVASWNAIITGYAEHGLGDQAVNCLGQMQDEGLSPDAVTFVCLLKACANIRAGEVGEEIHAEIRRQGLSKHHIMLGTALVDMYAKCGMLGRAQEVLNEFPARDVASWTALMAGYVQHGLGDEALKCFRQMQEEGVPPNTITFACTLKACGSIGATKKGQEMHAEIHRQGLLEKSIVLGSALVDMYAKCGALGETWKVFEEVSTPDIICWTALIAGYAQFGKLKMVSDLFNKMIEAHIEPNVYTFSVLLTACSHAGLVEEGQMYFDSMITDYGIIPTIEHYICMVDLLSRAGQFDKSRGMIEKVSPSDRLLLWSILLGACRKWANVNLGIWAFDHALQLDEKYPAAYVCMSNIYAAAGIQDEADEVKALQRKDGAWNLLEHCWWTAVGDEGISETRCLYAK